MDGQWLQIQGGSLPCNLGSLMDTRKISDYLSNFFVAILDKGITISKLSMCWSLKWQNNYFLMQNIIKPTMGHSLGIICGSKNSFCIPPLPPNKLKYNT